MNKENSTSYVYVFFPSCPGESSWKAEIGSYSSLHLQQKYMSCQSHAFHKHPLMNKTNSLSRKLHNGNLNCIQSALNVLKMELNLGLYLILEPYKTSHQ